MCGVASQNANHFWDNCESLWQSESQNCGSLYLICELIFNGIVKRPFFCPHPFIDKISPFFDTFYLYDTKMRIRCELLFAYILQ